MVELDPCYRAGMTTRPQGGSPEPTHEHDEDTIELELSAADLLTLSRAAAPEQPAAGPTTFATPLSPNVPLIPYGKGREGDGPPEGRRPLARIAGILGVAAAAVLAGVVAYLVTTRAAPVHTAMNTAPAVATVVESPPLPATETAPVQFRNPFDRAEVFEFPAGTSETEARDAVAQLLIQRARDRQSSSARTERAAGIPTDSNKPVAATGLARRD